MTWDDDLLGKADFERFRREAWDKVIADEKQRKALRKETRKAVWRGLRRGFMRGLGFRRD